MMMVGLLLIFAQAQAYTNENDNAWINAPRSGSILTTERVDARAQALGGAGSPRLQGVYCSPRSWLFAMNVLNAPDRFAAAKC